MGGREEETVVLVAREREGKTVGKERFKGDEALRTARESKCPYAVSNLYPCYHERRGRRTDTRGLH